jgi:hypothetical protein
MSRENPEFILYAQHGWADTGEAIASLARSLAGDRAKIVAPSLGWLQTWWRIEPLIAKVEAIAIASMQAFPQLPWRIIGHSMGGLIWLELLHRHPEWRDRVHSLVLVASPVGGADLARLLDPLNWGVGIARDLGKNRRFLASTLAQTIPTLVIAGDVDGGSDGTIPLSSTVVESAQFVRLSGLSHPRLKNAPELVPIIEKFWQNPTILPEKTANLATLAIFRLQAVPGMTDTHPRHCQRARTLKTLRDRTTIRLWQNPWGVQHVFVVDAGGICLYSGFVGWQHTQDLQRALSTLPV